jgi:hypothetical protein
LVEIMPRLIKMLKYSPLFSYPHDNYFRDGEILP